VLDLLPDPAEILLQINRQLLLLGRQFGATTRAEQRDHNQKQWSDES
jgi:hypothetical protein